MKISDLQHKLLRQLPGVDRVLALAGEKQAAKQLPKSVLVRAVRETLDRQRQKILSTGGDAPPSAPTEHQLLEFALSRALDLNAPNLQRVVNATGVVIHTNLGRSCLATEAIDHVVRAAGRYSNLEFDLDAGRRGSRYTIVEDLLRELTGAEAAMVVNNNAGAVLLCLDTLAHGKEVIISRGELVEIGGSFRIPDVMTKSGAILKEIGTTNRTHLNDYEQAIGDHTGLLLKVHTSNYQIEGFTAAVGLNELVTMGARLNQPVMEDLGSGNLIASANQEAHSEPTVQDSVATGVDVVTFSGDKLLGGPQAGFIVGRKPIIDRVKSNPLTRALRIDKLSLAAMEATLQLYRDDAVAIRQIPTLRMLNMSKSDIEELAQRLKHLLEGLKHSQLTAGLYDRTSKAGGGSLPLLELPSRCVGIRIKGVSVNTIERSFRAYCPPIIARIDNDTIILDPRTIHEDELEIIAQAIEAIIDDQFTGDHA